MVAAKLESDTIVSLISMLICIRYQQSASYKFVEIIHGDRVANALGCNARGPGFTPQPRQYL